MVITLNETIQLLKQQNNFLVLCHKSPDGDTIGSGYGLYYALKKLGKRVSIACSDPFPKKYSYLFDEHPEEFTPAYVVAVDVADEQLLGEPMSEYAVDLCIDHHRSHREFAKKVYVQDTAAATAEIIFQIINKLGVKIDKKIANCIYTGITTDTGCFRFSNTTADTHMIGARLLQLGAEQAKINQLMFENKSKKRVLMEREIISAIEFYGDDRISLLVIPKELKEEAEGEPDMFDGISAISRQIEGVEIGITIRYQQEQEYKISLRTSEYVDASAICQEFGGGGHLRAAGCTIAGDFDMVKSKILDAANKALKTA